VTAAAYLALGRLDAAAVLALRDLYLNSCASDLFLLPLARLTLCAVLGSAERHIGQ
jgi:hypothetical protein